MNTLSVAKFGGTSLATLEAISKSCSVLQDHPEIRLCVISATAGSTNHLIKISQLAALSDDLSRQEAINLLANFVSRHQKLADDIQVDEEVNLLINQSFRRLDEMVKGFLLLGEVSLALRDEFISHGELISSLLFYAQVKKQGIKAKWIDIRPILKTSSDYGAALPHLDLIKQEAEQKITPHLKNFIVVTQGFIGTDLLNKTTTLGKEGSDYSTALLAEALQANQVQIWKDVYGIMTSDPRFISQALPVKEISFTEIAELTRFGAKVIHPDTFLPVIRQKIPLYIGNSQDHLVPGTLITNESRQDKKVHVITMKNNIHRYKIKPKEDFLDLTSSFVILPQLQRWNKKPIALQTWHQSIVLLLDEKEKLTPDQLKQIQDQFDIVIEDQLSLLTLIGDHQSQISFVSELFSLVKEEVLQFFSSISDYSCSLLIKEQDSLDLWKKLHHYYFEQPSGKA